MVKPSKKALGKRKAPPAPAKGAKNSKAEAPEKGPTGKPKRKPEQPKKVKQRDQKFLPVPKTVFGQNGDDSDDMDEDDLGVEEGMDFAQAGFLKGLDRNALSRTVKENQRIHNLEKTREPLPKVQRKKELLRLPSPSSSHSSDYDFDSDVELSTDAGSDIDLGGSDLGDDDDADDLGSEDDEDDEAEGSGSTSTLDGDSVNEAYDEIDDDDLDLDENDDGQVHEQRKRKRKEEEADYEVSARTKWSGPKAKQEAEDSVEVGRLPIKLPNGVVQSVEGTTRIELPPSKKRAAKPEPEESDIEEEEEDEFEGEDDRAQAEKMAGQKGKFGRMGIAEIVYHEGWKNAQKLEAAKEQIAQIGAEILAGGELIDIGPVLTRMSTFALPTVPSPEDDKLKMPVPNSIRGLTLLSQLAVFKDLIPGYRIRQLTAMEEQEKVRDDVRRQREGEKLLVRSYKGYLKTLESETKRRTPLASISIRCMCDLLTSVTHFNYSENIMGVLVGRVARRSWDEECELVLQSFVSVFKQDITATNSQILVRLINRMIKERKFQVHPNVLTCLLHLRLRTELDSMKRGKNSKGKGKRPDGDKPEKQFKSDVRKKWQTKNQKKREREMKEVQKEMAEAEAEVDQEERAQVQTETLKNLFVLYFSILKHPGRSPLLPTALEGISQFAHFINVDFFRDLLAVLRRIIVDQKLEAETVRTEAEEEEEDKYEDPVGSSEKCRIRLLAIVTAFDLLTGQGEAINIDLGDFVASLYAILRPLSLDTGFEDPPLITTQAARFNHNQKQVNKPLQKGKLPPKQAIQNLTTSDLLFRCLHSIFFTKYQAAAGKSPTWRMAAFAKRLTECAMFFPPISAQKAVQFARSLVAKEPKLESMLDTEERTFDGVYKPELDDPQLCNPFATSLWEVDDLATRHWDRQVRGEAAKLRDNAAF